MTKVEKSSTGRQSLVIDWEMDQPPIRPSTAFFWSDQECENLLAEIDAAVQPQDQPLTEALNWSSLALGVLRVAFLKKLDRYQGWCGDKLPLTYQKAIRDASLVYKRGVGYRSNRQEAFLSARSKGRYKIKKCAADKSILLQNAFVIIDRAVYDLWNDRTDIPVSWDEQNCEMCLLDAYESDKNIQSVGLILKRWNEARIKRSISSWYVIGGGLLGDLAGFCAGLACAPVSFIPTTLLGMVDACVGGKTGVNFEIYGKNQVGLFYFPNEVWVSLRWLQTLPDRQWRSGAIECLKHTLLTKDPSFFDQVADILFKRDLDRLDKVIIPLIEVKSKIISADPAEKGQRAVLNLGHTLGHALESYSQKIGGGTDRHLMHGEAVGLGLVFALMLSEKQCGLDRYLLDRVSGRIGQILDLGGSLNHAALCQYLGVRDLDEPDLWPHLKALMGGDKKNKGSSIRWILMEDFGNPHRQIDGAWTVEVEGVLLEETWHKWVLWLRKYLEF